MSDKNDFTFLGGNMAEVKEVKLSKAQQRVFDYMVEFGSISTLQAFNDLGESRLSAMIFELKKKGVHIADERKAVKNRWGESRWIKEYKIV
jgi:hypothetical protein